MGGVRGEVFSVRGLVCGLETRQPPCGHSSGGENVGETASPAGVGKRGVTVVTKKKRKELVVLCGSAHLYWGQTWTVRKGGGCGGARKVGDNSSNNNGVQERDEGPRDAQRPKKTNCVEEVPKTDHSEINPSVEITRPPT